MWEIAENDLSDIRALALRPTVTSLAQLVTKLEALASQVSGLTAAAMHQGTCEPGMAAKVRQLQQEMAHTQRLLSSAATFYNGLATLRAAGTIHYERTGLLRSAASTGRMLAQL